MRHTYARHDRTAGEQCQLVTPLGSTGGAAVQQHGLVQHVAGQVRRGREGRRSQRAWTAQWWLWPCQRWPLEWPRC